MPTIETHLVVFCRRPALGTGKQRLAADLGQEGALAAARLLLAAALEDAEDWPGPVVLSPAEPADAGWAASQLTRPCQVIPQAAGNLGQRLNAVDATLRAAGARRIIYIGSDAPGLDAAYYAAARRGLEEADVIIGPARDGGVTLMGARQPWPELAPLPWSSVALGDALVACCEAAGCTVLRLEQRADVDRVADLAREIATLGADRRPARRRLVAWWQGQSARAQN